MLLVIGLTYVFLVLSFLWARLVVFNVKSGKVKLAALLYDSIVSIHIIVSIYCFIEIRLRFTTLYLAAMCALSLALAIFWWGIRTTSNLKFALSKNVGQIITTGPFRIVRHPFYLSYFLTWLTSAMIFNLSVLWISLTLLSSFYIVSAKVEESIILRSIHAKTYQKYKTEVGMFFPKATQWISWFSGLFRLKTK